MRGMRGMTCRLEKASGLHSCDEDAYAPTRVRGPRTLRVQRCMECTHIALVHCHIAIVTFWRHREMTQAQ